MTGIVEYFEAHPAAFFAIWLVSLLWIAASFAVGGRRAERRFREVPNPKIVFRERFASGYSNRSIITKLAGARNALDVVVTDAELWLKGMYSPLTYIGTRYDLAHRVPLTSIRQVEMTEGNVNLWFTNEAGTESHVTLLLKDPSAFLSAIGRSPRD